MGWRRQTGRQADREAETGRQRQRLSDRNRDRETETDRDRQTDRQKSAAQGLFTECMSLKHNDRIVHCGGKMR